MSGEARAIILAGGLGTRLRPLTDTIPKCLVPIAGRPLLDYWVNRLVDAGVRRAVVNNHAHADQVRAYVDEVTASGRLELAESYEPDAPGLGRDDRRQRRAGRRGRRGHHRLCRQLQRRRPQADAGLPPVACRPVHDAPVPRPQPVGLRDRRAGRRRPGRLVRREAEGAEERPGQRRRLRRGRRRLSRDRLDEGVRPRLRGPAEVRRPDAGLALGGVSPGRRHARGAGEGPPGRPGPPGAARAGRDRHPAGGVPRPRRDGDRAGPLPVRPRRGPPDPRRRPRPSGGSRRRGTPW